ncbi:NAD(P)H-binding protein [Glycocaulis albus]|jgi:short subunit dehydrogenase-like uncharacterized protein|uniref:NAD(P)H-binding protein n=1 Tax=Glycocaulis albus TaxID=1382801 RepID=UPI002278CD71|nr:NAD(P)H-binding protein [Glycocaulis albus]
MSVLVIGGYGHVGGQVAEILAEAGYDVRIGGRSLEKAKRFAARIGAEGVCLDVHDPTGWDAALDGTGMVVVCIDLPGDALPRRVLASGLRYVDISADDRILAAIERLGPVAQEHGGRALLSVGLAPGLTNMMANAVAQRVGVPQEICIAVMLGAGDSHGAAATDWMIAELAQLNGQPRVFKFARDQHPRKTWPMGFADQHVLTRAMPGVRVRTYFALDNRLLTTCLMSAGAALARLVWLRPVLRRALMTVRIGSPRTAIAVTATGSGTQAVARFEGSEEAKLTALIAARAAVLLMTGTVEPGVHHLGPVLGLHDFVDLFEPGALNLEIHGQAETTG